MVGSSRVVHAVRTRTIHFENKMQCWLHTTCSITRAETVSHHVCGFLICGTWGITSKVGRNEFFHFFFGAVSLHIQYIWNVLQSTPSDEIFNLLAFLSNRMVRKPRNKSRKTDNIIITAAKMLQTPVTIPNVFSFLSGINYGSTEDGHAA